MKSNADTSKAITGLLLEAASKHSSPEVSAALVDLCKEKFDDTVLKDHELLEKYPTLAALEEAESLPEPQIQNELPVEQVQEEVTAAPAEIEEEPKVDPLEKFRAPETDVVEEEEKIQDEPEQANEMDQEPIEENAENRVEQKDETQGEAAGGDFQFF